LNEQVLKYLKQTKQNCLVDKCLNNDKLNEINYLNAYTYFLIASAALDPEPKSDDFEKNLNLSDYSKIKENGLYDTQKARYVKMLTEDNYLLSIEAK